MKNYLAKLDLIRSDGRFGSIYFSLFVAFCASLFLYLETINIEAKLLNTILIAVAIYLWLGANKKESLFIGFFVGLFWFWWISLSFRYTDFPPLALVVPFGVALVYAVIFWLVSFLPIWGRAIFFAFGLLIIEPFGFAWMKLDLMTTNTLFSANFYALPLLLFGFTMIYLIRSSYKYLAILPIFVAFVLPTPTTPSMPNLKIYLANSSISQDIKWEKHMLKPQIAKALKEIDEAIAAGYEIVVLPEAVVPYFLNMMPDLIDDITIRSSEITIVMGALFWEDKIPYNSTYIFNDRDLIVANKMFLVPFGEGNPLPKWMGRAINNIFFEGASDYKTAKEPTDYTVKGTVFRNAICYEAAIERMYQDAPDYMIAISNNGWFVPSIEPAMQRLFMKLYAKRYGVVVFHASNQSPSEIVGG